MKVGFVSLGCPKNQLDTEVMLHEVLQAGYEITPEESEADIVIINTCAFIESAKQEAIDNILDVAWLKKNADLKAIVVTGCLAERYKDEIQTEIPEVDAIIGTTAIDAIVEVLEWVLDGKGQNWWCVVFPSLCVPATTEGFADTARIFLKKDIKEAVERIDIGAY